MKSELAPGLLIAVPQLLDGNFHRSVVFLLEHNAEGAFGVIINRPSKMKVRDLCENLGLGYRGDAEALVLAGGPVQPERGIILHKEGNHLEDSRPVIGDIFVCSTSAALERLFAEPGGQALCFAGYSGWGPGQLEREIDEGSWIPMPADGALIFDADRGNLWDRALKQIGIDPRFLVKGESDS